MVINRSGNALISSTHRVNNKQFQPYPCPDRNQFEEYEVDISQRIKSLRKIIGNSVVPQGTPMVILLELYEIKQVDGIDKITVCGVKNNYSKEDLRIHQNILLGTNSSEDKGMKIKNGILKAEALFCERIGMDKPRKEMEKEDLEIGVKIFDDHIPFTRVYKQIRDLQNIKNQGSDADIAGVMIDSLPHLIKGGRKSDLCYKRVAALLAWHGFYQPIEKMLRSIEDPMLAWEARSEVINEMIVASKLDEALTILNGAEVQSPCEDDYFFKTVNLTHIAQGFSAIDNVEAIERAVDLYSMIEKYPHQPDLDKFLTKWIQELTTKISFNPAYTPKEKVALITRLKNQFPDKQELTEVLTAIINKVNQNALDQDLAAIINGLNLGSGS